MTAFVYLDHHATTPVAAEVVTAMQPWFTEEFANAASISHRAGGHVRLAVEASRCSLAEDLGCEPEEIIFTSGATEANNLAIKGVLYAAGPAAHLVTNAAEHRAVLDPARRLQRQGYAVDILPVTTDATITPDSVEAALRPKTKLVSAMLANNEVGTINDLRAIATIGRKHGAFVHTDAAQAFGRIPIDFRELNVDLLSVTAHKLYGPKGIGALVVNRQHGRIPIEPLLDGGGHERGLRSGTLPVPLIVGFAAAARLATRGLTAETERLAQLRNQLLLQLRAEIPGLTVNGHSTRRLPNNLNVTIPNIDGEALLARLQTTDLAVSSGAACSSSSPEPSHVLRAMGLNDTAARASLRFGFGRGNTITDVDQAVHIITAALRAISGR
ncbi:MAG: cysteine desulfurase [Planctomycetaceae bacterium]|nr:cysteine desulfurase [Planctomycetaceae bacterium]